MLLAVDVGNTHSVLGLYQGERLVQHFRIESAKGRTTDEYHVLLVDLLNLARIECERVRASILSSVVPSLSSVFAHAVRRAFGHDMLVVGPGIKTGMPILCENPHEVGADRIVNAVAAYAQARAGLVVVDFGTATTFDCVSPKGEYLGGAISPGMQIGADALCATTAKLPRIEIARPPRVVGRNTIHAMQSGLVHGYAELVDGMVRRLKRELSFPCTVFATGGVAPMLHDELQTVDAFEPLLTLEGLRLVYEMNR